MAADREQDIKKITETEIAKGVISQLAAFPEISQEETIEAGQALEPKLEIVRDLGLTAPEIDLTLEKINVSGMSVDLADKLRARLEEQRKLAELKNPPTYRQKLTGSLRQRSNNVVSSFKKLDNGDKVTVVAAVIGTLASVDNIALSIASNQPAGIEFGVGLLALTTIVSRISFNRMKRRYKI